MSEGLQVFLVSFDNSDRCIVYSDPLNSQPDGNCIYNAGSLELIPDPIIEAFTHISGSVTPVFGVKPLILGYANGLFEVLYAPLDSPYLFRSDGSLARHDRSQVKVKSIIEVPDLGSCVELRPGFCPELAAIPLAEPNDESIQRYIQMSYQEMEYTTNQTYQEMRTKAAPVSAPPVPAPSPINRPAASESPSRQTRSPSPRPSRPADPKPQVNNYEERLQTLQQKVEDLEGIIDAMNRRSYKIYPVTVPKELRIGNKMTPVIEINEIQKRIADGEIEKVEFIPSFQPFAGSARNNNRFITYYGKDGSVYNVRADYDPKTNQINPPK